MKQSQALEILKSGRNVFLTGEPGAGKSHVIRIFTEWLRSQYRGFAVTASTGIAATHIDGVTIHSWTGLGIKEIVTDQHVEDIIENKPFLVNKMRAAEVLIIDEVSMLSAKQIDHIDKILRGVRREFMASETKPFGGLQVVFVGDFFQLPPISKNEPAQFAFQSEAWINAEPAVCYITEQHRQSDPLFLEILTAMRRGQMRASYKAHLLKKPDIKPETKLFTHNIDVDAINLTELGHVPGETKVFHMTTGGGPEFLIENMKKSCISPSRLCLKVGAKVMFTKNNFELEYVNGTMGEVVGFMHDGAPIVRTKDGREILVERAEWATEDGRAWIKQYPLRLAWAITVHKSQGMSLDEARIDLSSAFEYGQGYVAISRVRTLAGLYLEGINEKALMMHPLVVKADAEFRRKSEEIEATLS